ncbi:substance-K receptor-like [Nematostella vectensis]|uniref:substance-K receptor-like n=1 Tax=Nematostella vectensis TaxID=45351 RepID=UPI0013903A91|nr:substance-K receptor-like [Nematostella vectensis]
MNQTSNTTAQYNIYHDHESFYNAAIACLTVLGLWAIIGNTISLVVLLKTKSLRRRRSNYLLVNLCIADLLVGIYCLVRVIQLLRNILLGIFPNAAFQVFVTSLDFFSSLSSINFLAALSVERLIAVAFPFYHRGTGKTFYGLLIGTPWVIAVICTVAFSVYEFTPLIPEIFRTLYVIYVFSPLLIMSAAYTVIMIRSRASHIHGHGARERLRDKKLAVTLLIVTLASLATWIPFNCYWVIHNLDFSFFNFTVNIALLFLQYSNSCINIVVYAWRIPEFKQVLFRHKPVVATIVQGTPGKWNAGRCHSALAEPIEMHHIQRGEPNQIDEQLENQDLTDNLVE